MVKRKTKEQLPKCPLCCEDMLVDIGERFYCGGCSCISNRNLIIQSSWASEFQNEIQELMDKEKYVEATKKIRHRGISFEMFYSMKEEKKKKFKW